MYARLQLLEELVERVARVVGVAGSGRSGADGRGGRRGGRAIGAFARDGYPGSKQRALVGLILDGDAHRDGLHALEACGWLEMRALLAAMELGVALGASTHEICAGR